MEASNATNFNEEHVQTTVLQILKKDGAINNTLDLAKELNITHADLDKVLKSLLVDDYVKLEVLEKKLIELTAEGKGYAENGTPEFQYASLLELNKSTPISEVINNIDNNHLV